MYSGWKCNIPKWRHASSVDIEPNNAGEFMAVIEGIAPVKEVVILRVKQLAKA